MNPLEKSQRSDQAFEIFKVLLARGTTDWDFAPLAERAITAVDVFHDVIQQRYPTHVQGGYKQTQGEQAPRPPLAPVGMQGPSGI